MLVALKQNGVIVNIIEIASLALAAELFPDLEAVDGAGLAVEGEWVSPAAPPAPPQPDLPPTVPQEVTRRQGLQELRARGFTESMIETQINMNPDELQRDLDLIEFRASQKFERQRPLVISMGALMGLDLDEVFTAAAARL